MNRLLLKRLLMERIDKLPEDALAELAALADVLASERDALSETSATSNGGRKLGLLKGKGSFSLAEDLKMSDEALLSSG